MGVVGLTLLVEARRAGLEVRAEGDRLVVRGPRRLEPLARRLLEHKAEVLAVLRPCPTCGTTPGERELVRVRRALDAILAEYERHLSVCRECGGWAGPWCDAGRELRGRYLEAWLAWQAWRREEEEVTRP